MTGVLADYFCFVCYLLVNAFSSLNKGFCTVFQIIFMSLCIVGSSTLKARLLVSNRYYIRSIRLDGALAAFVAKNLSNAVALDYYWKQDGDTEGAPNQTKIFWTDVTSSGSSISSMNVNGTEKKVGDNKGLH